MSTLINGTDSGLTHGIGFFTRDEVMGMDHHFKIRMLNARRNGLEHFRLGVATDETAMVPTRFPTRDYFSYCSSSAALCAEESSSQAVRMGRTSFYRGQ